MTDEAQRVALDEFPHESIGEIHRTHANIRRLQDDVLRLAGEQNKLATMINDHVTLESGWHTDIVDRITNMHTCMDAFHTRYEPTLSSILTRAKYWSDTKDFTIRALIVAFSVSLIGALGTAVWFYVKHNLLH